MSLRSIGAQGLKSNNSKNQKAKSRLRDATMAAMERLEERRMLNAVVVPPSSVPFAGSAPLAPQPGKTFWINGIGGATAWNFNSSITPVTSNDLVLNVTPFSQSYTGCCEGTNAAPGNTNSINAGRLFTNGLTQNMVGNFPASGQTPAIGSGGISDASSGDSVLSQNGGTWWLEYNLGAWPGGSPSTSGYDISEIDVIAGHQDYRTGMQSDVQVQFVNGNTTDWFSLSNGANFSFTADTSKAGNPQVSRGAAQMAIVSGIGGAIASNVRSVKFVAANQQTWYREFVVEGTPSPSIPPPPPPVTPAPTAAADPTPGSVDITWTIPNTTIPISGYTVQRTLVTNGVPGAFTGIGSVSTTTSPITFTDSTAAAGAVYVYRIVDTNAGGSSTSLNSNFLTTPPISAEGHFYNQAFWTGPVVGSQGFASVSVNTGGAWPGTGTSQDSAIFTGKVTTNQSGVYTFISNTDDDGFLYVNGVMVSKDPGGHGIRNAGQTIDVNGAPIGTFIPMLLQANTSYDFVLMEHNSGGGAGANFMWVTPSNSGQTVVVPASNLTPVSDSPAMPSGLTAVTTNSNFINFTFSEDNKGVVEYLLQRKDVSAGLSASEPWQTVSYNYPGSNTVGLNGSGVVTSVSNATLTIQDPEPIAGATYVYRVEAVNFDGAVLSPETPATSVTTVADLVSPPTSGAATLTTAADASGLAAGTYFIEYTWTNSAYQVNAGNAGETAGSTEQSIVLSTLSDIKVALPNAPAGGLAVNGNIYIGTASGKEKLSGAVLGGQTLTISGLPFTAAKSVPTTNSAGLAPGTYFVAYTWVGNESQATGETAIGAIDNTTRIVTTSESSIVLTSFADLKISGFAAPVGTGAGNVNIYIGNTSGGEHLVGTVGPTGTLTVNTLTTPTTIPIPVVNAMGALSNVTGNVAIPAQSGNPSGVEVHMYNGRYLANNTGGNAGAIGQAFNVVQNGIPSEYAAISQNQSFTTFLPGLIDRDYNASIPNPIPQPVTQSPDFAPFPDIPRIEWEDFTQAYTGKLNVGVSGFYTIITNTDDAGFAWVNGTLVSADPGGHGQQDTTTTRAGDTLTPVFLSPGQSYNMTMEMQNVGGGAGAHLKWIEPTVNSGPVATANNNYLFPNNAAVTLNSALLPSFNLVGFTLFITSGTGSGQQARITAWDSTNHIAQVNVVTNGNNTLWATLPNSTSLYSVAWEEIIPSNSSSDNNNPTPNAGANGLTMRQDTPVQSTYNSITGSVTSTTSASAAGPVTITGIDPRAGVSLSWSDQSNSELYFEIQRSTNNTTWTTVGTAPFNIGTTFTDTTAGNAFQSPTISYFYRVRGVNFDGAGPFTSVVSTTNGLVVAPPTISSIVQGAPGTIGLIFASTPGAADTGGIDIQYAPINAGVTGSFIDATPVALPFNTFDYQVTGLSASQLYALKPRYTTSVNNSNANLFGAPVTFTPSGGINEAFGTPGTGVAGFTSLGDLVNNGNASLVGPAIPGVVTPATSPGSAAVSDVANPSTLLTTTVTADVPQPSVAGGVTTSFNNLALSNSASFFLEYTWLTASGSQTLTSSPQFVPNPGGGGIQITFQVPSSAPANVVNANVFIGTSSANSDEFLSGTVAPGATLRIITFPSNTAAHPPLTSSTGLLPGTYYLEYTFLNSSSQETGASPEQTVTVTNPSNDLNVGLPAFPTSTSSSTAVSANIYLGTAPGAEKFVTNSTTSGGTFTITGLPTSTQTPPTTSKVGLPAGTYTVGYTWQSSQPNENASGEGQISPLNTVVVGTSNTSDIAVLIPAAPAGAASANIYVGVPVANPTTPLTLGQGTGGSLAASTTYFVQYEWVSSGTTLASAEQTIALTSANHQITAVPPATPFGANNARIYVGSASGAETLAGTVNGAATFTINSLPVGAQSVDTSNTTGQVPIRVTSVNASTALQQVNLRSFNTSGTLPPPSNPTGAAATSVTAGIGAPTSASSLSFQLDITSSLTPGGTYFVEYTWLATAGGETTVSPESSIILDSNPDNLQVPIPVGPAGAGNANVYIGSSSGTERLAGQVTGGTTGVFRSLPASTAATPPTVSSTGVTPGTYFLKYTWTNGSFETIASPEQTVVTSDPNDLINVTVGQSPFQGGSARVYLGTASGLELFDGTTSSGVNTLTIRTLPTINAKPAPTTGISSALRYTTPANVLQENNNNNGQTSSSFNLGENIAGFTTSFDFLLDGNMGADGFGMVIQDQARNALPGGGGGFNGNINHSVDILFSLYPGAGGNASGTTGVNVNGAGLAASINATGTSTPLNQWVQMSSLNGVPTGVVMNSPGIGTFDTRQGDIYNVSLSYDNNAHILTETVKDLTMNAKGFNTQFTTSYSIDIVSILGMPAGYVGFIGSSGGASIEKDVLNWTFTGGAGVAPPQGDTINGTAGVDNITLTEDTDHQHIDWTLNGGPLTQMAINDPNGLTILGNGSNDVITLSYANGNPLPNIMHLDSNTGAFMVNGLQGTAPLAGTTIDIERSKLYMGYGAGPSPLSLIQSYLTSGYNGGTWTGTNAAGVITSANAAASHTSGANKTGIGYADSADGLGVNTVANSVELMYTLYGDTNLSGNVNSADLQALLSKFNNLGAWDQGDSNYSGNVNGADLQRLLSNFNTVLGNQVDGDTTAATTAAATNAAASVATTSTNSGSTSSNSSGTLNSTSTTTSDASGSSSSSDKGKKKHK